MKVYIFLHGQESDGRFYKDHFDITKSEGDVIICADGGYNIASSLNIRPHYIVGDLDSLCDEKIDSSIKMLKYPLEKDFSDFELALNEALKLEPKGIFVYGALYGRKDHELINIGLLIHTVVPMVFIEEAYEIYNVIGDLRLCMKRGFICTLVSFNRGCHVLEMKGFKYLLKDEVLKPSSRGLSNIIVDDEAIIRIKDGPLLVIVINIESRKPLRS